MIYLQGRKSEGKTPVTQQHHERTYLRRDQLEESKDDYSMSGKLNCLEREKWYYGSFPSLFAKL